MEYFFLDIVVAKRLENSQEFSLVFNKQNTFDHPLFVCYVL